MKVAIIGAGTMGSGIAQVFSLNKEYEVILCDIKNELAEVGKKRIAGSFDKLVQKGKMEQSDATDALARIITGDNTAAYEGELVLEAALEKFEIKRDLFRDLQGNCKPGTLFATNTSSLSITELSASLEKPVVGMHFFNPAPIMKLVEVITGLNTPADLAEKVTAIARSLGKEPVQVKDSAGFIVNRILIPMINEAICIFAEGVASADDIDAAMRMGANHPMGPLALADLIGLDVCLAILNVIYDDTRDPKHRAHPLLRKMVQGGLLGRKTGKGFYSY